MIVQHFFTIATRKFISLSWYFFMNKKTFFSCMNNEFSFLLIVQAFSYNCQIKISFPFMNLIMNFHLLQLWTILISQECLSPAWIFAFFSNFQKLLFETIVTNATRKCLCLAWTFSWICINCDNFLHYCHRKRFLSFAWTLSCCYDFENFFHTNIFLLLEFFYELLPILIVENCFTTATRTYIYLAWYLFMNFLRFFSLSWIFTYCDYANFFIRLPSKMFYSFIFLQIFSNVETIFTMKKKAFLLHEIFHEFASIVIMQNSFVIDTKNFLSYMNFYMNFKQLPTKLFLSSMNCVMILYWLWLCKIFVTMATRNYIFFHDFFHESLIIVNK